MDILNQSQTENTTVNPSLQDAINQMLHANDNRPGFMYEDSNASRPSQVETPVYEPAPVAAAPAPQYVEPAPTPTYQAPVYQQPTVPHDVLNALQIERARNEKLEKQIEVLKSLEQAMEEDPTLAEGFVNYYTKGPSTSPVSLPPAVRRQIEELQKQVYQMKYHNEAADLEREYPDMFRRDHVTQYMVQNNLPNLRTAFNMMLGEAVGELNKAQRAEQYAAQVQAWQQYQQQYQQALQQYQQPQQWAQAPSQQQNFQTSSPPPPSPEGVVLRPGSSAPMGGDVLDNYRAKSWKEAEALVAYDMRKAGFQV